MVSNYMMFVSEKPQVFGKVENRSTSCAGQMEPKCSIPRERHQFPLTVAIRMFCAVATGLGVPWASGHHLRHLTWWRLTYSIFAVNEWLVTYIMIDYFVG